MVWSLLYAAQAGNELSNILPKFSHARNKRPPYAQPTDCQLIIWCPPLSSELSILSNKPSTLNMGHVTQTFGMRWPHEGVISALSTKTTINLRQEPSLTTPPLISAWYALHKWSRHCVALSSILLISCSKDNKDSSRKNKRNEKGHAFFKKDTKKEEWIIHFNVMRLCAWREKKLEPTVRPRRQNARGSIVL